MRGQPRVHGLRQPVNPGARHMEPTKRLFRQSDQSSFNLSIYSVLDLFQRIFKAEISP